jgi:hypothetical protein
MAASKKAEQDPMVQAADLKRRDAMKAARALMVSKDKGVEPIIQKIEAASTPGAPRLNLTAEERTELGTARESLRGTPEGDALAKSNTDYREALQKAMVAVDPAVAEILAKLPQRAPMAPSRSIISASPAPAASASPEASASPVASPAPQQ